MILNEYKFILAENTVLDERFVLAEADATADGTDAETATTETATGSESPKGLSALEKLLSKWANEATTAKGADSAEIEKRKQLAKQTDDAYSSIQIMKDPAMIKDKVSTYVSAVKSIMPQIFTSAQDGNVQSAWEKLSTINNLKPKEAKKAAYVLQTYVSNLVTKDITGFSSEKTKFGTKVTATDDTALASALDTAIKTCKILQAGRKVGEADYLQVLKGSTLANTYDDSSAVQGTTKIFENSTKSFTDIVDDPGTVKSIIAELNNFNSKTNLAAVKKLSQVPSVQNKLANDKKDAETKYDDNYDWNAEYRDSKNKKVFWNKYLKAIFGVHAQDVANLGQAIVAECKAFGFKKSVNPFLSNLETLFRSNVIINVKNYNAIHNFMAQHTKFVRDMPEPKTLCGLLRCKAIYEAKTNIDNLDYALSLASKYEEALKQNTPGTFPLTLKGKEFFNITDSSDVGAGPTNFSILASIIYKECSAEYKTTTDITGFTLNDIAAMQSYWYERVNLDLSVQSLTSKDKAVGEEAIGSMAALDDSNLKKQLFAYLITIAYAGSSVEDINKQFTKFGIPIDTAYSINALNKNSSIKDVMKYISKIWNSEGGYEMIKNNLQTWAEKAKLTSGGASASEPAAKTEGAK